MMNPVTGPTVAPRCDFCLERGRERPGEHLVNGEWMCGPCFRGDGTEAEQVGGYGWQRDLYSAASFDRKRLINQAASRRYRARHREQYLAYQREYRRLGRRKGEHEEIVNYEW